MKIQFLMSLVVTCLLLPACLFSQDKYAVLVGVETYDPGMFKNLDFAKEDVTRIGGLLEDLGFQTTVMTSDAKSTKLKPYNVKNIWTAIQTRVNSCAEGDTLIVALSGHGVQFADDDLLPNGVKESYFCPEDADVNDKSSLLPISELMELINSCAASRKLLLVDACRNDPLSTAGSAKSGGRKIDLGSVHENERSVPGGMTGLFSCKSGQKSWESTELGHSVFSNFVAEYLEGKASSQFYEDGKFTLDGLVFSVRKSTNNFVFENNLSADGQKPVMRGENANWPLGTITELESYGEVGLDQLQLHAKLGFGVAQFHLGYRYDVGKGLPIDYAEAMKWYLQAAEENLSGAQTNIATLYKNGQGVAKDYSKAMEWYLLGAEQGSMNCQYQVAVLYDDGLGVPEDKALAIKWYEKAAEQGDITSQYLLGLKYSYALGISLNREKGMHWFRKAAEQGHPKSQFELGDCYAKGLGVSRDYSKAMEWYLLGAEQGDSNCQYQVAVLYDDGRGVPEDKALASKWYEKAAEQGHAKSQYALGYRFAIGSGVSQDYSKAMEWYLLSAEQGNKRAQYDVGMLHQKGWGVQKDLGISLQWFEKAAMQGVVEAQYNLGAYYAHGTGVAKNESEGVRWFLKAAEQGFPQAQYNLGVMYYHGKGVPVDRQQSKSWMEKAAAQGYSDAQAWLKKLGR